MTEEEARTKWCPFARAHWSGGVESEFQGNRFFREDGVTLDSGVSCLGSGCMAWRTMPPSSKSFGAVIAGFLKADQKIHAIKEWRQEYACDLKEAKDAIEDIIAGRMPIPGYSEPGGYCGAAGMPR